MNPSLLMPLSFVGTSLLAIWAYVRFPKLRPQRFGLAVVHVIASFAAFSVAPFLVGASTATLPAPFAAAFAFGAIVVPLLSYVLLSWVWLIARIVQLGTGGPRGGKLVDARS